MRIIIEFQSKQKGEVSQRVQENSYNHKRTNKRKEKEKDKSRNKNRDRGKDRGKKKGKNRRIKIKIEIEIGIEIMMISIETKIEIRKRIEIEKKTMIDLGINNKGISIEMIKTEIDIRTSQDPGIEKIKGKILSVEKIEETDLVVTIVKSTKKTLMIDNLISR